MADPTEDDVPENRTETRRRVLLTGKVVYGFPEMTLDCAISDLSQAGARVRLGGAEPLTDPIYLIVVRHGVAFRAREAWRDGRLVGLAFTQRFDLGAPSAELPKLVRQIWIEQTRGLSHE